MKIVSILRKVILALVLTALSLVGLVYAVLDPGACVGAAVDCDDGNPCTTDACLLGSCGHTSVDCGTAAYCCVLLCLALCWPLCGFVSVVYPVRGDVWSPCDMSQKLRFLDGLTSSARVALCYILGLCMTMDSVQ
jgi:hypothetical protein